MIVRKYLPMCALGGIPPVLFEDELHQCFANIGWYSIENTSRFSLEFHCRWLLIIH